MANGSVCLGVSCGLLHLLSSEVSTVCAFNMFPLWYIVSSFASPFIQRILASVLCAFSSLCQIQSMRPVCLLFLVCNSFSEFLSRLPVSNRWRMKERKGAHLLLCTELICSDLPSLGCTRCVSASRPMTEFSTLPLQVRHAACLAHCMPPVQVKRVARLAASNASPTREAFRTPCCIALLPYT